ncbi:MAG: site-specific DNA-methyltransferase [Patescibacteria group bacterium]
MNKIICGDSLIELPKLLDKSVDLVIVDPPYGINYKDWDIKDFNNFTDKWVKECFRILKDDGTMWSFMGYQNVLNFIPILNKYGKSHLENWVIWARQKGRGSSKHLKSQREDIFHTTKTDTFAWNNLKMLRDVVTPYVKDGKPRGWFINEEGHRVRWTGLGNVWVYTSPQYNSKTDKQIHPAQKPTMLYERLILLSSNEGDLILDPFMGVGTAGIASKNTNRSFIGIEISEEYCNMAEQRLCE